MYISDELAQDFLAGAILLTFPWVGIYLGTWGFFWEALMLFAVFLAGRRKGLLRAASILISGYLAALIVFGGAAFNQMGFIPLVGLLGVYGWNKRWPVNVTFFWGAALAAVLGSLPTLPYVIQGFDVKTIEDLINSTVHQYQSMGFLVVMQQQGISEVQIRALIEQGIQLYLLVVPSIAALIAIIEFGFVYYIMRRWLEGNGGWIPFTRWRLPWYAVWGAILGIACYLLGDEFAWPFFRGLGINLMVVYGVLTLVLGTAVYLYMLKSPRIPRFLKWTLVISSFIYFFFTVISIIMFGLFDLVFNFRRLPEEL